MPYHRPVVRRARQLLIVLIAFAFIGGTSSQLVRAAEHAAPMMMAGMPCDMMMSHAGMQHDNQMPPCKGTASDCLKQMGCAPARRSTGRPSCPACG